MARRRHTTAKAGQPTGDDHFVELGASGLKHSGGVILDEFQRELRGKKAAKTYREMAVDSTIGACLGTLKQLLKQVPVNVEDGGSDNEHLRAGELVRTALDDMSHTWTDFMAEIATMLEFGWSASEIVYKRREGDNLEPGKASRYSDGMIGWRKFAPRAQETRDKWDFDEGGGVQALHQRTTSPSSMATIPIEKLLLFRGDSQKSSPEPPPILRPAYEPWYFGKKIRVLEGIGIDRDFGGIPLLRAPKDVLNATTEKNATTLAELKDIGANLRQDEQAYLLLPSDCDKDGNYLYDIELIGTGARRAYDTSAILQRYDRDKAIAMLCDFILLGHENVGSFALADSKTSVTAIAVAGWLDAILSVINRHAIPRLLTINGMPISAPPTLVRGDVEAPDLQTLGAYITSLANAGMPMFPNPELEDRLMQAASLPVPHGDKEVGKSGIVDVNQYRAMIALAREVKRATAHLRTLPMPVPDAA